MNESTKSLQPVEEPHSVNMTAVYVFASTMFVGLAGAIGATFYEQYKPMVVRECYALLRSELKDPDSATLVEWKNNYGGGYIEITVRAQNSYGAFGRMKASCADGKLLTVTDTNRMR